MVPLVYDYMKYIIFMNKSSLYNSRPSTEKLIGIVVVSFVATNETKNLTSLSIAKNKNKKQKYTKIIKIK